MLPQMGAAAESLTKATGISRRGSHILHDRDPSIRLSSSDRASAGVRSRWDQRLRPPTTWHRNYCAYCVGFSMVVLAVYQQGASINVEDIMCPADILLLRNGSISPFWEAMLVHARFPDHPRRLHPRRAVRLSAQ